ncbi:MAG: hypothetical protein RJA44_832 [Pseudomonadota bacterium]
MSRPHPSAFSSFDPPPEFRAPSVPMLAMLGTLLTPLLLWQGRRMRRRMPRLPEASGPRAGKFGRGPAAVRLLIVGDSSAAGVGAETQQEALAGQLASELASYGHGAVSWQLVARTGLSARSTLALMAASPLQPADVLVTVLGVKDTLEQTAPDRWMHALDAIHSHARYRAGVRHTVHCAPPRLDLLPVLPQPLRWMLGAHAARLDAALRARVHDAKRRSRLAIPFAHDLGQAHEWLASDGFHPNSVLYRRWAEALAQHIDRVLLAQAPETNIVRPSGFSQFDNMG